MRDRYDGPIWAHPDVEPRRRRLTRTRIGRVAARQADSFGFASVTMRGVASDLGVTAMALYHYIGGREALLALMEDAVMADSLVDGEALRRPWREAVTAVAYATLGAFERHPWAIHVQQGPWIGPAGMRHADQLLAALEGAGLDPDRRADAMQRIDDYVFGYAMRIGEPHHARVPYGDDRIAYLRWAYRALATGACPRLRAQLDATGRRAEDAWIRTLREADDRRRFDEGLEGILDSLARRARRPDRRPR